MRRGAVIVVIESPRTVRIVMETVAGGSSRMEVGHILVGSRIAHQNLFGEGKFADLTAVAGVPTGGPGRNESYSVSLRYVDPLLFDSRRWFGIAGASWNKFDFEDQYGNFAHTEMLQLGATAGWRFADFSYLSAGVSYRPSIELSSGRWLRDGTFEVNDGSNLDYWFGLRMAGTRKTTCCFQRRDPRSRSAPAWSTAMPPSSGSGCNSARPGPGWTPIGR